MQQNNDNYDNHNNNNNHDSSDDSKSTMPVCPVELTLSLIGSKWKVLIVRELMGGSRRFGEIKKSMNSISQKVLTTHLREMETSGLLTRKIYAEVPPRVEYTLTSIGYSLKPVLDSLASWGIDYYQKINQLDN